MSRVPIDFAPAVAPAVNGTPSDSARKVDAQVRAKLAEQIVQMVEASTELFHDEKERPFAVLPLEARRAPIRLNSSQMRAWIARTMRKLVGQTIGKSAIDEAVAALEGIAKFDRPRRVIHHRIASQDGSFYLDLGDETGSCVHVTAEGWTILTCPPPLIFFRRPDSMLALPRPVRGGKLEDLRPFVNAPDDDALALIAAWMVSAFRPERPCPILAFYGEQGTAKSTSSRVVRRLVDPSRGEIRAAMRSVDDLMIAAMQSRILALDNLSGMPPWLSDALCRVATGGGLSKRTLYTDEEETVLEVMRPIVVNGIDDIANRPDFAERCIIITLRPIEKHRRRDEASFWREFDAAAPRLLGVLLDGLASALRNLPQVDVPELPRMADFALWSTAAEEGLEVPPGRVLEAYGRNQAAVIDLALDASPVASVLRRLLDQPKHAGRWRGEPSQLLKELCDLASDAARKLPTWPKTPNALSKVLRRAATFLRSVGVTIDFNDHDGRGDAKRRVWRIARAESAEGPALVSRVPPGAIRAGDGGDAGDANPTDQQQGVGDGSSRIRGGSNE